MASLVHASTTRVLAASTAHPECSKYSSLSSSSAVNAPKILNKDCARQCRKRGLPSGAFVICAADYSFEMNAKATREFALRDFEKKRAFKVIAGLQNFDRESVASIVKAAEKGGATHVDIACDPDLVRMVRSLISLPICVSAIEPEKFVEAVKAGAHMVEIGNFDSFYDAGRDFSADEVLEMTRRTRELLGSNVPLSVTVPHKLPLDKQVRLAEALASLGADVIQTEGGMAASPVSSGVHGLIEKAAPTLAATYSISRAVPSIPVMCASGLSDVSVPLAFASGAAGVGVGSAISKLNSEVAMLAAVMSISNAVEVSQEKVSQGNASPASSV